MWFIRCLHAFHAKRRKTYCASVDFQTKTISVFHCLCQFIFIWVMILCSTTIQCHILEYNNTLSLTTENEYNTENNTNFKNISIHAFYGETNNVILKINWDYISNNQSFQVEIVKLEKLPRCFSNNNFSVKTENSTIFLPDEKMSITFQKGCPYKIELSTNSSKIEKVSINYTIPDTASVRNISIFAFYTERDDLVKLNVTWVNPTDELLPTSHGIKIYPLTKSGHCEYSRPYERYGIVSNCTSIVLPSDDEADSIIIPGCVYQINVIAQPTNDLIPYQPYVNYSVPECVGKKCSCRFDDILPAPILYNIKQVNNNIFRITWYIPANSTWMQVHNLTTIYFSISPNHLGLRTKIQHKPIMNNFSNKYHTENVIISDIISGAFYEFASWVKNDQYCESRKTKATVQAKFIEEINWFYQILIPVMFLLMLILLLMIIWQRRCFGCIKNMWFCFKPISASQPHIRRIYRPTTDSYHGRPYLSVPMEYNNLYVEQEIDKYDHGKVDKFEVNYSCLKMGKEFSSGEFGQVYKALIPNLHGKPGYSLVAVKKLKKTASPEQLEEFLLEISMLKKIGNHPNIVQFLGCCTSIRQPYCIIMEFVPCGDLIRYLHALRVQYERKDKAFLFTVHKSFDGLPTLHYEQNDTSGASESSYIIPESIPSARLQSVTETEYTILSDITHAQNSSQSAYTPHSPAVLECVLDPKELQNFALQIARGMEYLERKQIVHRDLAARNVLINENKTLKVSDFGMSRSGIYVNSKKRKLPLRWLSVEAFRDNLYTSKSDVWAYGIVLWEIGTLGAFPYSALANHEVLNFLLAENRLEKPDNCTDELYSLMKLCWSYSVDERPSFSELVEHLESISNKRRVYIDFNQLNPSYVFPPTEKQSVTTIKKKKDGIQTIEMVLTDH